MIEVRYNENTGIVTGWWASRHGNHEAKLKNRSDEAIVFIDVSRPSMPLEAWLCDGTQLLPNPNYIESVPAQNPLEDILRRIGALETSNVRS